GAFAGRVLRVRHPEVSYLEEVKAIAHVGMAEHLRFREVEPGDRVERVGVGRGNAAIICRWIAWDIDELADRPGKSFKLRHIAHLDTCHFGRHERIAVDVSVLGYLLSFFGCERLSVTRWRYR